MRFGKATALPLPGAFRTGLSSRFCGWKGVQRLNAERPSTTMQKTTRGLLHRGDRRVSESWHYIVNCRMDACRASKHVEQQGDSFRSAPGLKDGCYPGERSFDEPHRIAGLEDHGGIDWRRVFRLSVKQCLHHVSRYRPQPVTEAHHAYHTSCRANRCGIAGVRIKPDEQIAGEQGLDRFEPATTPSPGALDGREIRRELLASQVGGGCPLLARLGLDWIPLFHKDACGFAAMGKRRLIESPHARLRVHRLPI